MDRFFFEQGSILVCARRPGQGNAAEADLLARDEVARYADRMVWVDVPEADGVSSTKAREAVRAGGDDAARMLTDETRAYIDAEGLYRCVQGGA